MLLQDKERIKEIEEEIDNSEGEREKKTKQEQILKEWKNFKIRLKEKVIEIGKKRSEEGKQSETILSGGLRYNNGPRNKRTYRRSRESGHDQTQRSGR